MSLIVEDPHDPAVGDPVDGDGLRCTTFGRAGYVEFRPWDQFKVVVVSRVIWAG
jgi:hypothetical protein